MEERIIMGKEEDFIPFEIFYRLFGARRVLESSFDLKRLVHALEDTGKKQGQGKATQRWIDKVQKLEAYLNQGYSLMPIIGCTSDELTEYCADFLIVNNLLFRQDQAYLVPGEPLYICLTESYGLMTIAVSDSNVLHVVRGSRSVLQFRLSHDRHIPPANDCLVFGLSSEGDTFVFAHCTKYSYVRDLARVFQIDEANVAEKRIRLKCAGPITSLVIFRDSSHIVFGSEEGDVGLVRNNVVVKTVTLPSRVHKITVSDSWIVVLNGDRVSVFTKRLEPLVNYDMPRMVCVRVSPDEQWIVCGGASDVIVLPINTNSRQVKKHFDYEIVAVDVNTDFILWGSKDGRIAVSAIADFETDNTEPRFIAQRVDSSLCALAFAQDSVLCGWTDGLILSMRMTTQERLQPITPKDDETAKQDQLMFGVESKPVTHKQRQNFIEMFFQGVKVPPYNFDDSVRLYVACARRCRELGYPSWTEEHKEFLESMIRQCIIVAKKEHAGAIPLLVQTLETQLRLFYTIM